MQDILRPTSAQDRLAHLDVLRGFALFGILLVNFEFFTQPAQALLLGEELPWTGIDRAADWLVTVLAEGKFYPLFSMLFGLGFALMLERARARARPFWGVYARRLGILLLFGLAHRLLVWHGDILLTYAIAGFLMLLLFRNTPTRRLLFWSALLILFPLALYWLSAAALQYLPSDPSEPYWQHDALRERIEQAAAIYREGTYPEVVGLRLAEFAATLEIDIGGLPVVLGLFLLGRWLLQSGRLQNPGAHSRFFVLLRRWGLGAGLPMSLVATWMLYEQSYLLPPLMQALGYTLYSIGGPLLALGYLAHIALRPGGLRWLAPAGQMALSNYLMQSLFWTWVFYGYGLGLWGEIPRFWQLFWAVAFFALQVVISAWWLRHFRFGPMEWVWRTLTYMRRQPFRRVHARE